MISEDLKTSSGEEPGTQNCKESQEAEEMTKAKNGKEYRVEETPKPVTSDTVRLTKQIGMFSGATIIVGNIVGSGIFLTPGGVLKNTGSLGMSMVVWVVSGLFSLVGALCFAELGTTITESGAEYSYIKESFGELPAFLVLWVSLVIIVPTGNMLVALVFGSYIIQPFYPDPDCPPPDLFVRIMAVLCVGKLYSSHIYVYIFYKVPGV